MRRIDFTGRTTVMVIGMIATMLAFVVVWCSQTTFRAMSDWLLYIFNIMAALLLALPGVASRRAWVNGVVMILLDLLLISNLMYCRTYLTAIPPDSYLLAGNLTDFTASVADSLRLSDMIFPLITALTWWLASKQPDRKMSGRGWISYGAAVAVLALAGGIGLALRGGFYKEYDRLMQSCYYSTCGVPTYTVAGHLIYCDMTSSPRLTPEIEAAVEEWLTVKEELRPYTSLPDSIEPRRNLVVVLLESFESWLIDTRIDGKEITPYINSLAADSTSLFFPNMLTQVASGRSIDCQLLLTSGLLPMLNTVYSMKYPATEYPSLCKALKADRDARSLILTCDKPVTWNQEVIARSMGYDSLIHRNSWEIDEVVGNPAKLSDGSFLRQSVDFLCRDAGKIGDKPFMLTFVTYSGHNPFRLPEKLKDPSFIIDEGKYPQKMVDYVTMAHYTDSCLATLVEYLKQRPDYDQTLILITGDHEGLAGNRAEILNSPEARGIVSPGQFTPFLLLNAPVAGHSEAVMGQIDMYPTLLAMLGLDGYFWKGQGQNVIDRQRTAVAVSSMTGEIAGDTTTVDHRTLSNILDARRISDLIITHDLLK
ncbi:MAG: sulfatase-like hydrolase/transferase [Lachnoclostridium sp.]|nr:sulfatase-like hydrolase/transferase [Lachnoclostridium sp.]